ncbi:MAG: cyclic nucleotide-binding domain-containing protein [Magnetococcales bacterium]|nr:cyclic nucleotide-binding domain-containing protein [Magnetococcales bacterium]
MEIIELLDRISFFSTLAARDKKRIADMPQTFVRYDKDELLIQQGSMGTAFFIIIRGSVHVIKEEQPERVLATLKTGAVVGEMAFLTKGIRVTSVVAAENGVVVMKLTDQVLEKLGSEIREKIKDQLIMLLVERVDTMNKALMRTSSTPAGH